MNIGICGLGVVGGALEKWLRKFTKHELYLYDPKKNNLDRLHGCDVTFICVPVPTNEDGSQNYTILEEALSKSGGVKFIRSTVLPGTNDKYKTFACPEFLTARSAYHDTCEMGVVTGSKDFDLLHDIFPDKKIICMSNVEAEIAKYTHNVFGALKVNYFNLIYNFCELRGADYQRVMNGVFMSGYINEMHTIVPGPDYKFGFGGSCFPKDLKAFAEMYPAKTFLSCIEENNIHRGES